METETTNGTSHETNGVNGTAKKTKGAKSTTVRVAAGKAVEQPSEVVIHDMVKEVIAITLVGSSPLIVNNFNEKSITEMEDLRRLTDDEKRAAKKQAKPPVIPEDRYQAARILNPDGIDCFPARYVKAALVTAATKYPDVGIPSTRLRGAVFVLGDLLPIQFTSENGLPRMRRDVVRVGKFPNKQPDLRYRPEYTDWRLDIKVEFEPALISLAALHHLIRRAGSSVGLGEWRPEKSPAGIYGRFDIGATV